MTTQRRLQASVILPFLAFGWAQTSEIDNSWDFSLPHGSLRISVHRTSRGFVTMGFRPGQSGREAPVNEQVEALRLVLLEMQRFGFDPQKLSSAGTHLWEQDVTEKLAYACADSPAWAASMRLNGKDKERLVVALLNESRAFEAYNGKRLTNPS